MKKIAFALYMNQPTGFSFLKGLLPFSNQFEKSVRKVFEEDYVVSFQWEEVPKEELADALVVPDSFSHLTNTPLPKINVPANLFLTKDIDAIKHHVDEYFIKLEA